MTAEGIFMDTQTVYPGLVDTSHASDEATSFFTSFFTAKTRHRIDETHAHFHPDQTTYIDATLGWEFPTNAAVRGVWETYMPQWGAQAKSYPLQIIGDTTGAAVVMTNTPELFGGEIRGIAIVDFADEKVIRWVDYWDGRGFGAEAVAQMSVPAENYPETLGIDNVQPRHAPELGSAVEQLMAAMDSADIDRLNDLLTYDATFEDYALRTKVRGVAAIGRYLKRSQGRLPYQDAFVRHIVGSAQGGGFEWSAAGKKVSRGATALTLDDGKITSVSVCWDGSLIDDEQLGALTTLAVEPRR